MVVEIFTFRLVPGASDADFVAADARVQTEFYYARKGIVRRTTARSGAEWAVVIFWQSMDDALATAEAAQAPARRRRDGTLDTGVADHCGQRLP